MTLPLHERALETDSEELVRMTLLAGGAAPALVAALIPARPLAPGEQYRFHFDMTKCIGCRSCEVACNEQNGNPADIEWRRVGELEGGTYPHTQRTYLSMACNHCLDAECLRGCPVDAYTKDPHTGIVIHSAEACIGCQYCVWNCPYSVPQFNPERGVVGKCDMCRGRLEDGLEPACVHACPENAIEIEIVNKAEWRANYSAAESPGMPAAGITLSTTRLTLPADAEAQLARVDAGHLRREHAHLSLVVMTTLVQATFGTLAALVFRHALDAITVTLLALLTACALNVSVFHLGRPAYAWRALKMWRRSWLSREVLLFGLFFGAIFACAAAACAGVFGFSAAQPLVLPLAVAASLLGLLGTIASAFIYLVPARPAWNMVHTPLDFLLSAGLIGSVLPALLDPLARSASRLLAQHGILAPHAPLAAGAGATALCAALWLANQAIRAVRLARSTTFESRAAFTLLRERQLWTVFLLALAAAALTPALLLAGLPWLAALAALSAVAAARFLFFVSVVPLNMALTFVRGSHA